MKSLMYVVSALAVMTLAFWAYTENYATQAALKDVRRLHGQIGAAHERLTVLNAEWAYLNRPERLRELADLNYERLGLVPLMPDHFGAVEQITYPLVPDPIEELLRSIEISADGSIAAQTEEPL